jgi:DNA polymerase I-like protein with 3'-5' exonuclease and polymerase domains
VPLSKSLDYNGDGRVRPQARIFGTYTSRMTYASSDKATEVVEKTTKAKGLHTIERKVEVPVGIALHQWKRGKEYRRIIQAPEGYTLCEFDFSGQEFRWMAEASGDETMLSLCAPGEDAHSFMGAQIAEIDYRDLIRRVKAAEALAELQRKLGKFSNLSFQYRVGAATATTKARVDYELDVTEAFIRQILATYKVSYPGVPVYWSSQIAKCSRLGYAETFAGRRVQLKGSWAGRPAWEMESTAINYPIQGTGGDQKYLALAVARNHLPTFTGYFYYELHDGLFFIFPNDKVQASAHFFKDKLSNLPYRQAWGFKNRIAFPVDAKMGPSWGELK